MKKILCIDDEADLRENVVEELEDAGYEVFEAMDGEDGLNKIISIRPDLVLCDITMPKKHGFKLVDEIRNKHVLFAPMPFIFLSALADKEHIIEGLNNGADAYLTKPVDFDILLATVSACLRQVERIRFTNEETEVLDI